MNNFYDVSISYSARKLYQTCPKQYWYRYINKDKTKGDPRDTLFGTIIGKIFEHFYNDKLWSKPDPVQSCLSLVNDVKTESFIAENYVKGTDYGWERDLNDKLNTFIPKGIETIKKNALLKPYATAEMDLTTVYRNDDSPTIRMIGRADFVIGDTRDNVWILDGKASKHRDLYVDPEQLIWYATCHYMRFRVAPRRLGFVFWSFPDDPLSWVELTSDKMRGCIQETKRIALKILDNEFAPKTSKACGLCVYKNKCEDGVKYLASQKAESGGRILDTAFDMEAV
jgi:hypothetical protein